MLILENSYLVVSFSQENDRDVFFLPTVFDFRAIWMEMSVDFLKGRNEVIQAEFSQHLFQKIQCVIKTFS